MIGTVTSVISINYTYTPKTITAQSFTFIANGYTCTWPPVLWLGPIIRDWNTVAEDEAWQHLNDKKEQSDA